MYKEIVKKYGDVFKLPAIKNNKKEINSSFVELYDNENRLVGLAVKFIGESFRREWPGSNIWDCWYFVPTSEDLEYIEVNATSAPFHPAGFAFGKRDGYLNILTGELKKVTNSFAGVEYLLVTQFPYAKEFTQKEIEEKIKHCPITKTLITTLLDYLFIGDNFQQFFLNRGEILEWREKFLTPQEDCEDDVLPCFPRPRRFNRRREKVE